MIIKVIIKEIYSLGDYEIFINVLKENKVAVNLYTKLGFNIKEKTDSRYYMEYKVVDKNRK